MSDDLHSGFDSRLETLRTLEGKLQGTPSEVVKAVGALLRRSAATQIDTSRLDDALRRLPKSAFSKVLEAVDAEVNVEQLNQTLTRAAEEAVEAGLSEDAEEQGLWGNSALDALRRRDDAESFRVGLERWQGLSPSSPDVSRDPQTQRALRKLQAALERLDLTLRPKARWFTPLNAQRRLEQDLLDPPLRDTAWWFTSRAGCDELISKLSGQPVGDERHFETCPDCRRDLGHTTLVDAPPRPHLTPEELWNYDLGLLSLSERRAVVHHADACGECAQLIHAVSEGEKAIAETTAWELDRGQNPPRRPGLAPTEGYASTRRPGKHLVAAQNDFRVLVVRDARRVRLLIQPLTGHGLAAAAVSLLPRRPIEPRPTAEGLEYELGESGPLQGKVVRVRVRVKPDSPAFERDIDL